jgi:hypothetical protein
VNDYIPIALKVRTFPTGISCRVAGQFVVTAVAASTVAIPPVVAQVAVVVVGEGVVLAAAATGLFGKV